MYNGEITGSSMKAYLLARVSTDDQKDALPAQTMRLLDYVKSKGYEHELFEIQESAYKGDRQYFRAVVEQIALNDSLVVVVFDKIDRLTRDPTSQEYIRLLKLCEAGKIELHFPSDNIFVHKDSPASDKMRLGFGITMSQYYSAAISDNVKRRLSQMLRDGVWTGAAPFGYRYVILADGKKWLAPDEFQAHVVKETFSRYASGLTSLKAISHWWLDEFGLQTRHSRIEKILKNPFYYGDMRIKGILYPHNYDQIISFDLFEKVQSVLHGYSAKPHRWAGLPFPYRGLIHCHECDCKVTFEYKKNGKYTYGHCTQSKYKHEAEYVNENIIEKQFIEAVQAIRIPDEIHSDLIEVIKAVKGDQTKTLEQERTVLQTEIAKYDTRLNRMYVDRLDGKVADYLYDEKHKEFTESKHKLQTRLQKIELLHNDKIDEYSHLLELANKAPKIFEKANHEQKRDILNQVLSNSTLDGKQLRWKYKKPFALMALCSENANWQGHVESNHDLRFWRPLY